MALDLSYLLSASAAVVPIAGEETSKDAREMVKKAVKKNRSQRQYNDLVGIDFATTATKVVRLKRSGKEYTLVGIEILPKVDFASTPTRMQLPKNLLAYYGCLCYSGSDAVMRMVNTPLPAEEESLPESKVREMLSVDEKFRVSARMIKRGAGRQDSSFLAVAVPQKDVDFFLNAFSAGPPAPASLEISGLSFVSAFLHARGSECANDAVCLIEAGEVVSNFVFLNKGDVLLVGKMDFGGRALRTKLAKDLGVDDELATSILNDRSINISASLGNVLGPFIKQVSISKDFIERLQGCRVTKLYLSGGLSLLPSFSQEIGQLLHMDVMAWSPLENINCDTAALPAETTKQVARFSAAIGAALGGFEEQ